MATTETAKRTSSIEEFEWNLKLILTIVSPEGIQLNTISDTYKKYINKNIDPSMLQVNSKYWTTVFETLPLLCKTFELFEHHELSCTHVKIRPVGNSSKNIDNGFIKKIFLLANYKKALVLSNGHKCNHSESESTPELEINNLRKETDRKSDNSNSKFPPNNSDRSFEEEGETTAAKKKRKICKSATQDTLDPIPANAWKEQLNPEFTVVLYSPSRVKQLARRSGCPGPSSFTRVNPYLFSYNCMEKKEKYLCRHNYPDGYSCVLASGDTVYEIGGRDYDIEESPPALSTVKIYKSGTETKGPNLIQPTMNASACIVKESLYLIGGNHLKLTLNTVQRLNLKHEDQGWNLLRSMKRKRSDFGVAVVGSYIYTIGGEGYIKGKNTWLKSGEVYDTEKNSWKNIPDMKFARRNLNMCVLDNNLIYAISERESGGNCTMEQYNCELETWKSMADLLPKCYIKRQIAVTNNNLIFLLGEGKKSPNNVFTKVNRLSKFMEVYDPRINQWNTLPYEHYFDIRSDEEFITHFVN